MGFMVTTDATGCLQAGEEFATLTGVLGWDATIADEISSRGQFLGPLPNKQLVYYMGHSVSNDLDAGTFDGLKTGTVVKPTDADFPGGLKYQLCFLNSCLTAMSGEGQGFISKFNTANAKNYAYLGWKAMMEFGQTNNFGEAFFVACNQGQTLSAAALAAKSQMGGSSQYDAYGRERVYSFCGTNSGFTIDMNPAQ